MSSAPRPAPAERAAAAPPPGPAGHRPQPQPPTGRARRPLPPSVWEGWDDEKLLDLRLCDLGLSIDGSGLEDRLAELFRELEARGLRFRPHYWLSDIVEQLDDPRLTSHERLRLFDRIREEVTSLWLTEEVRGRAPRVLDEVRNGLYYFEESL